jgi:hypothetical protein
MGGHRVGARFDPTTIAGTGGAAGRARAGRGVEVVVVGVEDHDDPRDDRIPCAAPRRSRAAGAPLRRDRSPGRCDRPGVVGRPFSTTMTSVWRPEAGPSTRRAPTARASASLGTGMTTLRQASTCVGAGGAPDFAEHGGRHQPPVANDRRPAGVLTATFRMPTPRTLSEHGSVRLVARHGSPSPPVAASPTRAQRLPLRRRSTDRSWSSCTAMRLHTRPARARSSPSHRRAASRASTSSWLPPCPATAVDLLVAPMSTGTRELVAGMLVDPQFGRA